MARGVVAVVGDDEEGCELVVRIMSLQHLYPFWYVNKSDSKCTCVGDKRFR